MLSEKREAEKGKKEYQPKKGYNKGGTVEPSSRAAITQNILETIANPTGRKCLKKGGPVDGGGWRRPWGQGGNNG